MSEEQSHVLSIAPKTTPDIEEKLTVKTAMSTVLNRVKALETELDEISSQTKFLRTMIEEYLNE